MPIPASRALVPFRPFMTVRVGGYDDEPAGIRTYANRQECEEDLSDWIAASVIPDGISGGCFNPGQGWYTFTACEHGELRHRRGEYPDGGWHFGPWPEEAEARRRIAMADCPRQPF